MANVIGADGTVNRIYDAKYFSLL
ncbi:hypothetical protein KL86CLO1_10410 [uncultured Eubacteriales bacterium]|uniref:Uncharacterized protein n=1 Tax=uncultured Eubacteriales bacterium TaxID=172733 RepID=A0A212J2G7_9FIRM|nr:hypothetical protein KL86CLO1_10410 [uncultured Eubacteriales bacterium]